jgi:hypothetical protein
LRSYADSYGRAFKAREGAAAAAEDAAIELGYQDEVELGFEDELSQPPRQPTALPALANAVPIPWGRLVRPAALIAAIDRRSRRSEAVPARRARRSIDVVVDMLMRIGERPKRTGALESATGAEEAAPPGLPDADDALSEAAVPAPVLTRSLPLSSLDADDAFSEAAVPAPILHAPVLTRSLPMMARRGVDMLASVDMLGSLSASMPTKMTRGTPVPFGVGPRDRPREPTMARASSGARSRRRSTYASEEGSEEGAAEDDGTTDHWWQI